MPRFPRWSRQLRRAALAAAVSGLLPSACAHNTDTATVAQLVQQTATRPARGQRRPDPLVVFVERNGLRALDPVTGRDLWSSEVRATGHLAAASRTVLVPTTGGRLVGLDRFRGGTVWSLDLPGEALTGLDAAGRLAVATVIGGDDDERTQVVGISTWTGHVLWRQPTSSGLGVPDAAGRVAFVPQDGHIVAYDLRRGTVLSRQDVDAGASRLEHVRVRDGHAVAGTGTSWTGLSDDQRSMIHSLADDNAQPFPARAGFDFGYDHYESLRWVVRPAPDTAAVRDAVFLGRALVVGVELDEGGAPARARWARLAPEDAEFVGVDVGDDFVSLVRSDGELVLLTRTQGHEVKRISGGPQSRGALFVDMDGIPSSALGTPRRSPSPKEALADVLERQDSLLLPAQRLAARLLWQDGDAASRDLVLALRDRRLRGEATRAADELRAYASVLVDRDAPEETFDDPTVADASAAPATSVGAERAAVATRTPGP